MKKDDDDQRNPPQVLRTSLDWILKNWKPEHPRPLMREVSIEEWPDLPVLDNDEGGDDGDGEDDG